MNLIMAWNSQVVMYPIRERLLRNEFTERGCDSALRHKFYREIVYYIEPNLKP